MAEKDLRSLWIDGIWVSLGHPVYEKVAGINHVTTTESQLVPEKCVGIPWLIYSKILKPFIKVIHEFANVAVEIRRSGNMTDRTQTNEKVDILIIVRLVFIG